MVNPDKNYKLKKVFVEFHFILINNLKFVEHRKSIYFIQNIHLAVPWTLLPGAAAHFAPF